MKYIRQFLSKHPKCSRRLIETFPAVISWNMILFPLWGMFIFPQAVISFLSLFCLYNVYKYFLLTLRAWKSYQKIKEQKARDFLADLTQHQDASFIRHFVIIVVYKEPVHILLRTLEALQKQTLNPLQIIPVIAFEERAGEELNHSRRLKIEEQFGNGIFGNLCFTYHPANLPGEVIGKSSNQAWAICEMKKLTQDIHQDYLIVSSVDADVVFHPSHFAALSWQFLTSEDRHHRIWQGTVMFYNNINRIPSLMRVFSQFSAFYTLSELQAQETVNISTYHMSWRLLEKCGFWDRDVIAEDIRFFFKAYFETEGKTRVEAIFLPVYSDAAEERSFWKAFKNTYEQVKRWAWGTSEIFYLFERYTRSDKAIFNDKNRRLLWFFERYILWPVYWFCFMLGPFYAMAFSHKLTTTLWETCFFIFLISTLGLIQFLSIIQFTISLLSRPDFSLSSTKYRLLALLEIFLTPLSILLLFTLPGLEAHTRLFLGKKLEYHVTQKI